VPFDDDAADDVTGFGPPPHPDDRLWRHPSELFSSGPTLARVARHRWPWGLVAGAGTIGVMLVGAGAFMVGLRDRVVNGRSPAQAAIAPLGSEPITDFDVNGSGLLAGPLAAQSQVSATAPAIVRIEGAITGSGVVVRDDGIVLTHSSVVGNLPDVRVTFDDGSTATGTSLGGDPVTNVAVVDLPGDGFAVAELVAPQGLTTGDGVVTTWVSDAGNLLAAPGTLAETQAHIQPAAADAPLDGLLQITRGSQLPEQVPGGPVIDGSGAVLGLVAWSDESWLYATPIDVAAKVADDLLATGTAQHGWIGIAGQDTPDGHGVLVSRVYTGSPVTGTLLDGDVVTAIDGEPVTDMSALVGALLRHRPGDRIELTYTRAGDETTVEVTLDALPDDQSILASTGDAQL
jgi:S1-C subfamily serine protease